MIKIIATYGFLGGCVFILLSLGIWQINRLEWKNDVISKIDAQEAINPMNVELDLKNPAEFKRGYLIGKFANITPIHVSPRTYEGKVGIHVLQPFKTNNGQYILVNRGWVDNQDINQINQSISTQKIAGYLKSPDEKNMFTPQNRPDNNLWYHIDFSEISKHYERDFIPLVFYLEKPNQETPLTFSGLPKPRNKHVQYASFWFSMAGLFSLLCIAYALLNRKKVINNHKQ
jgi:surfeit locus 1 family protein